jgi:hypothetical protein
LQYRKQCAQRSEQRWVDHISIQKLWEKVASVSGASALHTITQTHSINHSLYLSILP